MRILVLGYVIKSPLGGLVWSHLQYMIGLKRLGHQVLFLEDSDDFPACYNPDTFLVDTDPSYGLRFIAQVFDAYDLKDQWAYYDAHSGHWYGQGRQAVLAFCAGADLVLNLGAVTPLRDWWLGIPVRVLVDTDPAFTQVRHLTEPATHHVARQHTHFFSFAENINTPGCTVPPDGFPWQPTRQPFVAEAWKPSPPQPAGDWTTVMQWNSYQVRTYNGQVFGMKSESFKDFEDLPRRLPGERFELVVDGSAELIAHLEGLGWRTRSSVKVTRTPWTYQQYIGQSKGEWSVAKHGYVASNSGWFSERSLSYLATGRPVLVQDTGFTRLFETGKGLFAFTTPEEALEGMREIDRDYLFHCRTARAFVEMHFEATRVLRELLNRIS